MSDNTNTATTAAITTTQKIAAVIGGAGMGLSITDVTEILQLIGAATGAVLSYPLTQRSQVHALVIPKTSINPATLAISYSVKLK